MLYTPITKKHALLCGTVLSLMALNSPAFAQLPANLQDSATSEAGAGRVEERFQEGTSIPQVSPRVDVKDLVLQQAPEGADSMCFMLNNLEIEGANSYDAANLSSVYADQIGNEICLDQLYGIATRLTNKYRNDGYILTQVVVPPQTIENGTARLKVVEGYVDKIIVEGSLKESEMKLIRAYADNIQTGKALNARELERELLLINDLPGIQARTVLGPSAENPGAADMRVIVEKDPYDAFIGIDNHGSRYLGPLQTSAAGSLNSFFGFNERITAQVVFAPNLGGDGSFVELAYYNLGYTQPINDLGTKANVSASYTATEPGYILDTFDVKGQAQSFSAGLSHPFIRSRNENLFGRLNFDVQNVRSKNILEPTRKDRIRALRLGATYEFMDTFWRVGVNSIDFEVSQGLNILGGSEKGDDFLTRAQGDPTFTKSNLGLQRLQSLTSNLNLLVKAKGQLSNNALLSSEEFGVGGLDIGRAYDPSEIVGDEGMSGKLELQWNRPYELGFVQNYQLFSFVDAGRIWNDDAVTSSTKTDTLTSAGLGIRADFMENTKAAMAVAFPLNRDIETQGDDDPRFYFSLNRSF